MPETDPFTVIQALPELDAGGVERGTLEIARALVERGHHSIVVSAGGQLVADLIKQGSEHITMPIGRKSPLTLRYIFQLRRRLQTDRINILHASSRLPAWVSYLAWKGMDPKTRPHFITSVHGPYSVNRYSKIMLAGEKVIAISNFIKAYINENYPDIDPGKIVTIPRGIAVEDFPRGHRPHEDWMGRWHQEFPQSQGRFLITLPARLTRWKGHEDFFLLFEHLKQENNIHGLIVGGPDPGKQAYFSELKKKVQRLGLQDKISFTGHRHDIREIMSISGVVLSLSKAPEAFGRTALEALALGVPVIAYDHGGIGEVLGAVFPQGLVPVGDIDAAVNLIKSFRLEKPVVPEQNPYTLKRMQSDTIALYESVALKRVPHALNQIQI
jgi:glycosyltransferase involved in cell wall biosynthesis